MIYCENKIGKVIIDDEFNIKSSENNINLIKTVIADLKLAPENGSPTYILANELKKYGFIMLDVQLPPIEQVENMVY